MNEQEQREWAARIDAAAKALYDASNGGDEGPWDELRDAQHSTYYIFLKEAMAVIAAYLDTAAVSPDEVVISRADLRYALDDWVEAGHEARPVDRDGELKPWWGKQEQAIYDRLRAKVNK